MNPKRVNIQNTVNQSPLGDMHGFAIFFCLYV